MNNDDVRSVVTGFLLLFAYTFVYFIGYSSGRKDEEKEQEKIAVQAGIGYYHVDQETGKVKFRYSF